MELSVLCVRMAASAEAIRALAAGVSEEQWRWRPGSASWSILEVINHLADEEVEDFRTRVDLLLHRPGELWPPTDPAGWVTARSYNEQDPADSLRRYLSERRESLSWLGGLASPDWEVECVAPWGSKIRAGDIMASWAAHDLLHARQLIELRWAYMTRCDVGPYRADYAGEW